jgi:23S rRNA pseudouridine1911/1915/1917 synthase
VDDIPILWKDEHLVVVAKPPRLLVVSAPGRKGRTIADILGQQLGSRVYPVHRLDEDVTGALVLARQQSSKAEIESLFRNHEAQRIYLALLSHAPDPVAGRIESRLREGKDGIVRSVTSGPGDLAITEYQTLRRESRYTLVECRLQTGRRNQIRAHMSDLSCPIVGDRKYGFRVRGGPSHPRPLLHAEQLRFDHPMTGESIHVVTQALEPELRR